MHIFRILGAAALMLTLGASSAMALSTEHSSSIYGDSAATSSKFADPDDQAPAMLAPPDLNSARNFEGSAGAPVQAPSVPQMTGAGREGQQSFDHAFSHLSNQNQ